MPKIPGITPEQAVKALERAGFTVIRQGKHVIMSDGIVRLTIPRHNPVNGLYHGRHRKRRRPEPGRVQEAIVKMGPLL